jgi:hypothetical protein
MGMPGDRRSGAFGGLGVAVSVLGMAVGSRCDLHLFGEL